jgi:Tol biopolymer transport system component
MRVFLAGLFTLILASTMFMTSAAVPNIVTTFEPFPTPQLLSSIYNPTYNGYQLVITGEGFLFSEAIEGSYTQGVWSPDGTQVAYTYDELAIEVVGADGMNRQRLTTGDGEHSPAWSPDGTTIAYASDAEAGIFLMDADGSNPRNVRADVDGVRALAFSPDGEEIVFIGVEGDTPEQIYITSIDGTELRSLAIPQTIVRDVAWAADGTIAYSTPVGVFLTDASGTEFTQLVMDDFRFDIDINPHIVELTWSPDSAFLVVTVYSDRLRQVLSTPQPYNEIGSQFVNVHVESGYITLLTYGNIHIDPAWRPVTDNE